MVDAERPHEVVAIGLNERSKYTAEPKAKLKNFKPRLNSSTGAWELSSFSVDQLESEAVWDLLDRNLNKPALGKAELETAVVVELAKLKADPDWDPERHVNVVGWPQSEEEVTSAAQVLFAKQACALRD